MSFHFERLKIHHLHMEIKNKQSVAYGESTEKNFNLYSNFAVQKFCLFIYRYLFCFIVRTQTRIHGKKKQRIKGEHDGKKISSFVRRFGLKIQHKKMFQIAWMIRI